jgi:hypothetical protein
MTREESRTVGPEGDGCGFGFSASPPMLLRPELTGGPGDVGDEGVSIEDISLSPAE